jgi:hypothetical protein
MVKVLRDLDRRVTANCKSKLRTRPLVREGAPQHEDPQMSDSTKNLVMDPIWGLGPKQMGRLTVGRKNNLNLTTALRLPACGDVSPEAKARTLLEDVTEQHSEYHGSILMQVFV